MSLTLHESETAILLQLLTHIISPTIKPIAPSYCYISKPPIAPVVARAASASSSQAAVPSPPGAALHPALTISEAGATSLKEEGAVRATSAVRARTTTLLAPGRTGRRSASGSAAGAAGSTEEEAAFVWVGSSYTRTMSASSALANVLLEMQQHASLGLPGFIPVCAPGSKVLSRSALALCAIFFYILRR